MTGFNVNMSKRIFLTLKAEVFQSRQQRRVSGTLFQGVQW